MGLLARSLVIVCATPLAAAYVANAGPAPMADWRAYDNVRFGYSIDYPAAMFSRQEIKLQSADRAHDAAGIILVGDDDKARLVTFGRYNDTRRAPAEVADAFARNGGRDIVERDVHRNGFELSGTVNEGEGPERRFHEQVTFNADQSAYYGYRIEYVADEAGTMEQVAERIRDSFAPPRAEATGERREG